MNYDRLYHPFGMLTLGRFPARRRNEPSFLDHRLWHSTLQTVYGVANPGCDPTCPDEPDYAVEAFRDAGCPDGADREKFIQTSMGDYEFAKWFLNPPVCWRSGNQTDYELATFFPPRYRGPEQLLDFSDSEEVADIVDLVASLSFCSQSAIVLHECVNKELTRTRARLHNARAVRATPDSDYKTRGRPRKDFLVPELEARLEFLRTLNYILRREVAPKMKSQTDFLWQMVRDHWTDLAMEDARIWDRSLGLRSLQPLYTYLVHELGHEGKLPKDHYQKMIAKVEQDELNTVTP